MDSIRLIVFRSFGYDDAGGTRRYQEFDVEAWIGKPLGPSLDARLIEPSPFNP